MDVQNRQREQADIACRGRAGSGEKKTSRPDTAEQAERSRHTAQADTEGRLSKQRRTGR
jgi:hypothetical protein